MTYKLKRWTTANLLDQITQFKKMIKNENLEYHENFINKIKSDLDDFKQELKRRGAQLPNPI